MARPTKRGAPPPPNPVRRCGVCGARVWRGTLAAHLLIAHKIKGK